MATILQFSFTVKKDWSNVEQAEFARAATLLRRSGLQIACEWGLSDEGDPWTIFLRQDTGDVIAHIAKIDGRIFASSTASGDVVAGPNLRSVMDKIMRSQPLVLPPPDQGSQIHLHPATVLLAFIATAFVWSQKDDDSHRQEWRVGSDGAVEVELRGHATSSPGSNLLRDAVLSKSEIARLGLDARFALSDSIALGAATAALALAVAAADTFPNDAGTPLAELEEFRQAPELRVTLAPNDGDAPQADGDHGPAGRSVDIALRDEIDGTQPRTVPESAHVRAPASPASSDANDHHMQIDQAPSSDHAPAPIEPAAKSIPVMLAMEPGTPKNDARAVPVTDGPVATAHDDLHAAQGTSFVFAHDAAYVFAPDAAGQLLALVFGVKNASDLPATLTPSAVEQEINDLHAKGTDLHADGTGFGSPSPTDPAGAPASPAANGYQLLADIVSFAFNPAHELSPPPAEWQLFQQTLIAQPFQPASKVLIIDAPDLQANIFHFSGGLAMMTQQTAEKLLPDVPMTAQLELSLANGTVLKLIGVIDMHPDPHLS